MRRAAWSFMLAAVLVSNAAGGTRADEFTSAEFLGWSAERQSGYFSVSASMAGIIASQLDRKQARCIDTWYFSERAAAHASLLGTMRKYPTYHPQAIILWVIQDECGRVGKESR